MSRFINLEFHDEPPRERPVTRVLKDAAFHLVEAGRAFEDGQFEQALRSFGKVLEFDPESVAAWVGQVRMLIEMREFLEARLWADKALEKFPREPELLAAKAVALGRIGDLGAAIAFSDAALEVKGDSAYVWLARGDVLLARKEKRADYCFEQAFARASGQWMIHWLASRICAFYQLFSRALKHAQQCLDLEAGKASVWLQIGRCQQEVGLSTQAQQSFLQALQLDPTCREASAALTGVASGGFFSRLRNAWKQLFFRP
ncbi:MAG: tetratricopeptide repeat protein [Opitutaceae bacterium]|nr:tetratricopeptide repeat protein [Verrucomicrobiales bacterium]